MQKPQPIGVEFINKKVDACRVTARSRQTSNQTKLDRVFTDAENDRDRRSRIFGSLGRNTFRGPAFYNYDFAFIKDTPFGKGKGGADLFNLQFRAEFFNIFNIVTMGLPANTLEGAGFGVISKTAGNSRQIQFSLKLIY